MKTVPTSGGIKIRTRRPSASSAADRRPGAISVARLAAGRDNSAGIVADGLGAAESGPAMYRGMAQRIAAIPRHCGVWLGLLALAFQLGLSIGHVPELDQDWGRAGAPTRASAILGPASDRSPAHVPAVPPEDRCPICFALAVCGTFIPPTAILVILAPVLAAARLDMPAEIGDLPLRPFSPAQPRAPPLAAILG